MSISKLSIIIMGQKIGIRSKNFWRWIMKIDKDNVEGPYTTIIWTSGCPWPKATLKSPVGARDLGPVLFFLIFYSLFGPCPALPFIFSYLLLFIWPLPCPPFYFSLSFTLYLAPALPALLFFLIFYSLFGPCPSHTALPLPCPARQTDRRTLPCPAPCLALPCLAARFSASGGRAVSKLSGGRAGSAIENCIGIAAIAEYRGRPVLP